MVVLQREKKQKKPVGLDSMQNTPFENLSIEFKMEVKLKFTSIGHTGEIHITQRHSSEVPFHVVKPRGNHRRGNYPPAPEWKKLEAKKSIANHLPVTYNK